MYQQVLIQQLFLKYRFRQGLSRVKSTKSMVNGELGMFRVQKMQRNYDQVRKTQKSLEG